MSLQGVLLVAIVLAFAWSIGAHYTGACMGMPYGSGSIKLAPALLMMAVLALLGGKRRIERYRCTRHDTLV